AARPGHLAAARGVHSWMVERVGETAESTLMSAREQEAMGRYPPARTLVNAVLDEESEAVLPHTMVDAWLRSAALAAAADDRLSARRALDNALLIAEPLDALRPFAEARPTVRELLAQWHSGTEVVHEFARRALAAGRARNRLATMLSERELTVLSMLPSLLSLEDIARDLIISVNTVKSHVRAVYRKLGVSSRRAAVLAAHEHGLIGGRRPA
ncbi:MAG: response regulator transcription factor, partial [Pseudonocardia sp.]|nr:response regulator transcription factor [Pseudonocardia sp.]